MPAIFSSSRMWPVGRSMPVLVPIPSSPRRRAPRDRCRAPPAGSPRPRSALNCVTSPSRKVRVTPVTVTPRGPVGTVKRIVPLAELLVRAGEHLAGGHVAPAVGVDPRAAGHVEGDVGAVGLDPDLARAAQPLDEPVLVGAQLAPGLHRVGTIEEQRAVDELGVVLGRTSRPAGRAPASARSCRTSAATCAPRAAARGRWRRARSAPGRRRRAPPCWRARRSTACSRSPAARPDRRARSRRGGARWRSGRSPRPATAARCASPARRRAAGSRGARRAGSARPAWSSRRAPAGRARPPDTSRTAAPRTRRGPASDVTAPPCPGSARRGGRASTRARTRARPRSPSGSGRSAPSGGSSPGRRSSTTPPGARTAARSHAGGRPRGSGHRRTCRRTPRRVAGVSAPRRARTLPSASVYSRERRGELLALSMAATHRALS